MLIIMIIMMPVRFLMTKSMIIDSGNGRIGNSNYSKSSNG